MNSELKLRYLVTNSKATSHRLTLTRKHMGLLPLDVAALFESLYYHPLFIKDSLKLIEQDGLETEALMLSIRDKLTGANYFKEALELRGVRKVVAEGLEEMVLSMIVPEHLGQKTFSNTEKESSLKELLFLHLQETHHFNYAKLVEAVLADLTAGKYDEILAQIEMELSPDLNLYGAEKTAFELVLSKVKSSAVLKESTGSFEQIIQKKVQQLCMKSKITEAALVAEMLAWMQDHGLDCAQNAVLVLDYNQYAPIFYHLSKKHGLPIYLAGGLKFHEFSFYEAALSKVIHARQLQRPLESLTKWMFPKGENELEDAFLVKAANVVREIIKYQEVLRFESIIKGYDLLIERLSSLSLTAKELGQDENGMLIGTCKDFQHLPLENLAILGLDSSRYPIKGRLNSLLTDEERVALNLKFNCNLKTSEDVAKGELIEKIVGNVSGEIFLGFTSHSKDTGKVKVPSSLFNKILTYTGRTATLSEVYKMCGISSDLSCDLDLQNPFLEIHHSEAFLANKKSLESHLFSEKIDVEDFGEFKVEKIRTSASQLEHFFKCPYKYFLMDLCRIRPPELEEEDVTFWLDAMTFGTYLHGVYERLLKPYLGTNNSYSDYLNLLSERAVEDSMAQTEEAEKLGSYRPEVPAHIKDRERQHIKELGLAFLEKEKGYAQEGFYPVALEEDFREKNVNLVGVEFNGKIDRIDANGKGAYRIIDYKSGRNRHKDHQSDMFVDSQDYVHLQHGLYSVAARAILGQKVTTIEAGYYFATDYGQWKREMRNENIFLEKFKKLIELYKQQVDGARFYKNPDHCSKCDVKNLCYNRPRSRSQVLTEIAEIKALKGLLYER